MVSHIRSFLKPDDRDPPDLGLAIRLLVNRSSMQCSASSFLYYLLFYSPNETGLADEMLRECLKTAEVSGIGKLRNIVTNDFSHFVTVQEVYQKPKPQHPDVKDWVARMFSALPTPSDEHPGGSLPALNLLASHYLTQLCIPSMFLNAAV
jgi:hypothetical protein